MARLPKNADDNSIAALSLPRRDPCPILPNQSTLSWAHYYTNDIGHDLHECTIRDEFKSFTSIA
jgi:hypothetical protein